MSDLARDRYAKRLATVGYDPANLVVDDKGTMVDLRSRAEREAPKAGAKAVRLPLLLTEESDSGAPDVRMDKLLGEGGMGRVMSAQQVALQRDVAVKLLRTDSGPVDSSELLREALVTGRLEHPNIVPVYLLGRGTDGMPLLVMRRIEGVSWLSVLHDPRKAPGLAVDASDPLAYHLDVFLQVCDAVHFAHSRGVLHRDLKPENVMLGAFGEVYLVDWGIAVSLVPDTPLPYVGDLSSIAGTPAYMAPEMAAIRTELISARTDVYLLGAILHEIVTGGPPHKGQSAMEQLIAAFEATTPTYGPKVPEELATLCARALAPDPAQRFASADELRRAVLDFRKHRSSWVLTTEADRRARELGRMLDPGAPPVDERELRALFAECRFGYRQALAAWEGNGAARLGLRRAMLDMARFELGASNPRSAQALLDELDDPPDELLASVRELLAAERQRGQRLADLEKLSHDLDFSQGETQRSFAMGLMGLFWFAVAMAAAQLDRRGIWAFGYREAIGAILLNALIVALAILWVTRTTRVNAVQRKVLFASGVMGFGFVNHWWVSWWMHVPLSAALASFLLWVGGGWLLMGILIDRRMAITGVAFGAAGFATGLWPRYGIDFFGASVLAGYLSVAWAWRRPRGAKEARKA